MQPYLKGHHSSELSSENDWYLSKFAKVCGSPRLFASLFVQMCTFKWSQTIFSLSFCLPVCVFKQLEVII